MSALGSKTSSHAELVPYKQTYVRVSQQLQLGKNDGEEVTISLPFVSIFHIGQSIRFFSSLALPGKELDWKLWFWGKVSGAWAWFAGRCFWRQMHLVTRLQICTSLGGQDALITFLLSLAKGKHSRRNYRVPDCESLSSLTFQLQICGSRLPARAGSRREALAEAHCACLGSNLPFAECF